MALSGKRTFGEISIQTDESSTPHGSVAIGLVAVVVERAPLSDAAQLRDRTLRHEGDEAVAVDEAPADRVQVEPLAYLLGNHDLELGEIVACAMVNLLVARQPSYDIDSQ